jgi:dGTPase
MYAASDRERWVREDPAHKLADREDFARDRARVVHSSALRRLAAKTQVVQPGSDDSIRNRLTHSLEVAQIGREFGSALGCDADVVDTACLAHDLGHPPFGHNGEEALDEICQAIGGFEGNAQTLRLLTRLEAKRSHPDGRPAGLNLTRASLDAVTKYPWDRSAAPPYAAGKFGVYGDDAEVFGWMRADAPPGRRCLEAQVMDWSDDVGYSVHDVEDAVTSGRVDLRALRSTSMAEVAGVARRLYAPDLDVAELLAAHDRLMATGWVPESHDGSRRDLAALKDMTSTLIGRFVSAVEQATRRRYGPGRLTRYAADLVVPDGVRAECAFLKGIAAHFVMLVEDRRPVLSEQREAVRGLVDALGKAPQERLEPAYLADFAAAPDDGARLRALADQVAAYTDARAWELYRLWT